MNDRGEYIKLVAGKYSQDGKDFCLKKSNKEITLTINHPAAERAAAYFLLRELGFVFAGPTETWRVIPNLSSYLNVPDSKCAGMMMQFAQVFSTRNARLDEDYYEWFVQNGLYYRTIPVLSHPGTSFNRRHRKAIEAHPEWRAVVGGKRSHYGLNAKLDYSHPEVIDLYKRDAINAVRAAKAKGLKPPYYVGVGPPDKGGFTEAPYVSGASVSDQVFGLANEVARAVKKEDPAARVSLLAYTYHSDPPSFALEPNVEVYLTLGWFQHSSTDEEVLQSWWEKTSNLGVRNYSGVPGGKQVRIQQPDAAIEYGFFTDLVHNDIIGYREQSVHAYGPLGFRHYLLPYLLNNDREGAEAAARAYFEKTFGSSAGAIETMYSLHWSDYRGEDDLTASKKIVAETFARERDPVVKARLTDLQAYLIYLQEIQLIDKPTEYEKIDRVLDYLRTIHDRKMINTQLAIRHFNKLWKKAHVYEKSGEPLSAPRQLSDKEINERFNRTLGKTKQNLVSKKTLATSKAAPFKTGQPLVLTGRNTLLVSDRVRDGSIDLNIQVGNVRNNTFFVALSALDNKGRVLETVKITKNNTSSSQVIFTKSVKDIVRVIVNARAAHCIVRPSVDLIGFENLIRFARPYKGSLALKCNDALRYLKVANGSNQLKIKNEDVLLDINKRNVSLNLLAKFPNCKSLVISGVDGSISVLPSGVFEVQ